MLESPELIWSGVVGALAVSILSLITSHLNNKQQNKRQEQQFKHDSDQRSRQLQHDREQRNIQLAHDSEQQARERQHDLRREVYLEAATALGKMQDIIAAYAAFDVPDAEIAEMGKGINSTINRIQIVGNSNVIRAFTDAHLVFVKSIRTLVAQRIQVADTSVEQTLGSQFKAHVEMIRETIQSNRNMIRAVSEFSTVVHQELQLDPVEIEEFRNIISSYVDKAAEEMRTLLCEISGSAVSEQFGLPR